ncbi:MCE family protein [Nocardia puris]|uniref:Virulence factor Mce-like protein n=1 Tax=Nocardia puris TaxID=208602 RepID=A0A366E1A7_9NOCA|nr:MlaD family protein [Nocardia puris]MBF6209649.1 MCE family protein [Nocardia puris]MBF6366221.1 MCE family protein [Nocardia puris]MBF6458440.1 MCE family protein [Nocardia puris]RBO96087.1 virulence factor Mce-like protein [Nocardia puris]
MKPGPVLSLGAILAIFVLGAAYLAFGVVRVDWFRQYMTVTMAAPDSGGLLSGSPVLMSGIEVGQVVAVDNLVNGVEVRLRVAERYRIPVDSTARIEALSAVGEPYLEFIPEAVGGPYLRDGQQVDADRVSPPLSIAQMATVISGLLDQLEPTQLRDLTTTVLDGMREIEDLLPRIGYAGELLAATLLSRLPQLRGLLTDIQEVGMTLDPVAHSMIEGGPYWDQFGERVREVVEHLEHLMRGDGFPETYRTGTGLVPFLEGLSDELDVLGPELRSLLPVFEPLASTATTAVSRVDLSDLISRALAMSGDGAGVRLRIAVR